MSNVSRRASPGAGRAYFLANVFTQVEGCKVWPYSTAGPGGYGVFRWERRQWYVHSLACQAFHGPRPPGMVASHTPVICHTPRCFNGEHLTWKTRVADSLDRWADGTVQHGENWMNAKLTQSDVDYIRAQVAAGARQSEMAEMFGVGRPQVHRIVHNKQWAPKR